MNNFHRVVIVGGGFGGLAAARSLRSAPVQLTLIDRRNFHLFQPLLYQVATGALSPANIAAPLRSVLRKQRNVRVLLAEASGFDPPNKQVVLADGRVSYDSVIVAAGVTHSYLGNDAWADLAPGLKTVEDATEIRARILLAFERAERETDPARIRELLTFVIVGGGPTGVELAGALAEIANHTLRHDFRTIDPTHARVLVIEHAPRVLTPFTESLSIAAQRQLCRIGVEVITGARVVEIADNGVKIERNGTTEAIRGRTVLWAAGVQAAPLAKALADATGAKTDRAGRILVNPDLTVPDHPEIFVIGDMACCADDDGKPLPGIAPVAIQQGRYAARVILARLSNRSMPSFRYRDKGMLATIGRAAAVAHVFGFQLTGLFAWFLWLFVHLMHIVQFENRVLILVQWAWSYFTWNRTARLITGERTARD